MRIIATPSFLIPFYTSRGEVFVGTDGVDYHFGGRNSDRMMGSEGADYFNGRSGRDRADYSESDEAVTVMLGETNASGAVVGRGGHAEGDRLFSVESLTGSRFDDVFGASDASNRFDGGDGYDTLSYAGTSRGITIDYTTGAQGEARGSGAATGDTMINVELVIGTDHGDRFIADEHAADFDGGRGFDVADLSGVSFSEMSTRGITIGGFDDGYVVANGTTIYPGDPSIIVQNVEEIIGTDRRDVFYGSDRADRFIGGDGNDTFHLSAGRDFYDGGAGDGDTLNVFDTTGITINLAIGIGTGGDAQGDRYRDIEDVSMQGDGMVLIGDGADNTLTVYGDGAYVSAGGGDDFVIIDGEDTFVHLGDGDDTVLYEGDADSVILDGGDGFDIVHVSGRGIVAPWQDGVVFDLRNGEVRSLSGGDLSITLRGIEGAAGTMERDIFIDNDGGSNLFDATNEGGMGMTAQDGADIFVFRHRGENNVDVIDGFDIGEDRIDLDGSRLRGFRELQIEDADDINWNNPPDDFMYQDGADTVIVTSSDRDNSIRLIDVNVYDLSSDDFIF